MAKLMNNNVMKLIVYTGIFYGTSFGMEKKEANSPFLPAKLYIEDNRAHSVEYKVVNLDGSYEKISDQLRRHIQTLKDFQRGSFTLKESQYYAQGDYHYASYVAINREPKVSGSSLNLKNDDFFIPVECNQKQLKELVRWCRGDSSNVKVFVLGRYDSRLHIETISCDVKDITRELALEFAEEKRQDAQRQLKWKEKCQRKRDTEACGRATFFIGCLCLVMIGAHFGA